MIIYVSIKSLRMLTLSYGIQVLIVPIFLQKQVTLDSLLEISMRRQIRIQGSIAYYHKSAYSHASLLWKVGKPCHSLWSLLGYIDASVVNAPFMRRRKCSPRYVVGKGRGCLIVGGGGQARVEVVTSHMLWRP